MSSMTIALSTTCESRELTGQVLNEPFDQCLRVAEPDQPGGELLIRIDRAALEDAKAAGLVERSFSTFTFYDLDGVREGYLAPQPPLPTWKVRAGVEVFVCKTSDTGSSPT